MAVHKEILYFRESFNKVVSVNNLVLKFVFVDSE